jgi:hypothetical protein
MSVDSSDLDGPQGDEVTIGVALSPVRFKASRQRKDSLNQSHQAAHKR